MATTIITKYGSGAPTAADVVRGELAVDTENKRLYTEDSGGSVVELGTNPAANVTFGDDVKAVFGAGSDLQIYHDGTHNFIEGANAGNIYIRNQLDDGDVIIQSDDGLGGIANYVQADGSNGEVRLFHYGSEKLNTTSTGIDVTGTVTADGLTVNSGSTNEVARFESTDSTAYLSIMDNSTSNSLQGIGSVGNDLTFYANNAEAMRIASGNVGIGTDSPASRNGFTRTLEVAGSSASLVLTDNSGAGASSFEVGSSSGSFRVYDETNERLRIDYSGNVGIGTTAGTGTGLNIIGGVSGVTGDGAGLFLGSGTSASDPNARGVWIKAVNTGGSDNAHAMSFATNTGSTTPEERMRIDSSGNLLVGKLSSSATTVGCELRPDGTIVAGKASSLSGSLSYLLRSTTLNQYQFYVNMAGTISARSTSISSLSDERVKENIVDLETGLDEVMALRPRRFDWSNNSEETQIAGFIAQEVETVLPDLIGTYQDDNISDLKSLKMGDMIPTLVKAIQEQQNLIESLTARIAALEGAN